MFYNNLRILRESKNLTQRKIADHFKIKYSTYNDWEQNNVMLSIKKADKFALYYNVSLSTVLGIDKKINDHQKLKPFIYDNLLKNLIELKNKNKDTYETIGKILYCKRQVVHRYFTGQREIPSDVLYKLSNYYKIDIDTLCGKK